MSSNDYDKVVAKFGDPKKIRPALERAIGPNGTGLRAVIREHPQCLAQALRCLDRLAEKELRKVMDLLCMFFTVLKLDDEGVDVFLREVVKWEEAAERSHPLISNANTCIILYILEGAERAMDQEGYVGVVKSLCFGEVSAFDRVFRDVYEDIDVEDCRKAFSMILRCFMSDGVRPIMEYVPTPVELGEGYVHEVRVVDGLLWSMDPRFIPKGKDGSDCAEISIECPNALFETLWKWVEQIVLKDRFPKKALDRLVQFDEQVITDRIQELMLEMRKASLSGEITGWIPGGGLFEFRPSIAGCEHHELGIDYVKVMPLLGGTIPDLEFDVQLRRFDATKVERWAVTCEAIEIDDYDPGTLKWHFRVFVILICLEQICAEVPRSKEAAPRCRHKSVKSGQHGPGVAGWCRYRRLAQDVSGEVKRKQNGEPHSASDEAIRRAVEDYGMAAPLAGMTFAASPPQGGEGGGKPRVIKVSDEILGV